jgi:hypothetical protein
MTVAGPVNLGGKTVTLNAGSIADAGTQTITAQNLSLNARTGGIGAAGDAINVAVTNLRVTTQDQDAYVASAGGYNLGAAASSVGTGTLGLAAGGAVTQSAGTSVAAGSLVLTGAGGNFTLTQSNSVDTLAASTGAVNFVNSKALTVGTVNGVSGVTGTGNVTIQTTAAAGNDITLANNVAATGAGSTVTIASGEDIHYGTATLAAGPGGRWLTYSRNPAFDTGTIPNPGNAKPNIYNSTVGAFGPGVVLPATGNHHVYSYQPVLEYVATPASRAYGDPNPALTGTITGLGNGDTAADAYSGTATWTTTAVVTSPAGSYPITGAGLASDVGYGFAQAPGNATAFTLDKAVLTVNPNITKQYGDLSNPTVVPTTPTVTYAGFKNGETATVLGGTLLYTTTTDQFSNAGSHAGDVSATGGFTATNYSFVYNPGATTIAPAPLTVTPNVTRTYGDGNPAIAPTTPTVIYSGFKNGETAAVLGGALAYTTVTGAAANVGAYAGDVTATGGFTSANYTFAYNPGTTTITAAPLAITANDAARPEGQPNPPFSATYAGFKNGETPAALGGALAFTTPATIASPPGPYAITPLGQTSTNYAITYLDGVLTVTALPPVPVPPAGGAATTDNAPITALQRAENTEDEVAPREPAAPTDCLVLQRPGQRRVLHRCY